MQFKRELIRKVFNLLGKEVRPVNILGYQIQSAGKDLSKFDKQNIKTALKYSLTSYTRLEGLLECINYVNAYKIPGDIVECGVYKGGNILLAGIYNMHLNMNKKIWAYDTFTGMSKPTDKDVSVFDERAAIMFNKSQKDDYNKWCFSSLNEVKDNLKKNLGSIDNFKFVVGKVEDTLCDLNNIPDQISILRLDTDWYESTKKELEVLYPRLVPNGVLIIDDYGYWKGSKEAVDEYFKDEIIFLKKTDFSCRILIKR